MLSQEKMFVSVGVKNNPNSGSYLWNTTNWPINKTFSLQAVKWLFSFFFWRMTTSHSWDQEIEITLKITKSVLTNLSSWMGLWADTVQRTLIIKQHRIWTTWYMEYFSSESGAPPMNSSTVWLRGFACFYHGRTFPTICLTYLVLFSSCIMRHYFYSQDFWKTWFLLEE